MLFIFFMVLLVVAAIDLDYNVIEIQKRKPNHLVHLLERLVVGGIGLGLLSHFNWPEVIDNAYFGVAVFQFFFPVGLNIARGKSYAYLGDSVFDRFLLKVLPTPLMWTALSSMIAMSGIAVKAYGIQVLWTGY